jgi:predicted short-subunit dehydrogenase-like oxidoreductase (DUF2520 family)
MSRRLITADVSETADRLASRMVNSLRAGRAVRDCAFLEPCELVLVSVPAAALAPAARRLAAAPVDWRGKVVLSGGGGPGGEPLDVLRDRGAATGSLWQIGCGARYAAEGDRAAVREARPLVHLLHGRMVELTRPGLGLYAAGISFATTLFTPLIAASVESLRHAGCSRPVALEVADDLFQRTLRAWVHSGRKSWTGPLRTGDLAEVGRQMDALANRDPRAARYYRHAAAFALEYFHHPGALKDL